MGGCVVKLQVVNRGLVFLTVTPIFAVRLGPGDRDSARLQRLGPDSDSLRLVPARPGHYGLLWATGFVPAENGGAPEIFKTSWGLDRQ